MGGHRRPLQWDRQDIKGAGLAQVAPDGAILDIRRAGSLNGSKYLSFEELHEEIGHESVPGVYVLRAIVSDGALEAFHDTTVTVNE